MAFKIYGECTQCLSSLGKHSKHAGVNINVFTVVLLTDSNLLLSYTEVSTHLITRHSYCI